MVKVQTKPRYSMDNDWICQYFICTVSTHYPSKIHSLSGPPYLRRTPSTQLIKFHLSKSTKVEMALTTTANQKKVTQITRNKKLNQFHSICLCQNQHFFPNWSSDSRRAARPQLSPNLRDGGSDARALCASYEG